MTKTKIKYQTDIKRFSGYRIQFARPDAQAYQWQQLKAQMMPFLPVIEMASQEPYWLDDTLRGLSPVELLTNGLANGEFFAALHNGDLVCVATIRDIFTRHSGYFEGWSHPDYRTLAGRRIVHQVAHEIFDYAFNELGETGLGLIKLKAEVAAPNRPALCAMRALKFVLYGGSPGDALHHGTYQDTLHLELLNPAFFNAVQQGKSLNVKEVESATPPDVQRASSLRSTARSSKNRTGSAKPEPDNDAGRRGRGDVAEVAPTGQRPDEPRKPRAVRGKLRPAIQQASPSKQRKRTV